MYIDIKVDGYILIVMEFPTKIDIQEAHIRIKPYINRTPILTSSYVDSLTKAKVFFKCENLQKTGSFKVRGAANKILQLKGKERVCTHSSGNHAQAVSFIAQELKLKAYIVMPLDTPQVKKNAVKHYQAEIIESGPTQEEQ